MSPRWRFCASPSPGVDAVVTPVCTGDLPADLTAGFLAGVGFTGAVGQVLQLPGTGDGPVRVLLGVGPRAGLDGAVVRTAAALLARAMTGHRSIAVHAPLPDLRPLVEGYLLGGYRFAGYRVRRAVRRGCARRVPARR